MAKTSQSANAVEATNLFHHLYNDAGETLKSQNLSIIERSLKRRLQSSYDDSIANVDRLKVQISQERSKLDKMNINVILQYHAEIENYMKAMEYIALEYNTLFNEEISK